jgi:hypothetical protein
MTSHLSAVLSSEMSLRPSQSVIRITEQPSRPVCFAGCCYVDKWRSGRVVVLQSRTLREVCVIPFNNVRLQLADQHHGCKVWTPL